VIDINCNDDLLLSRYIPKSELIVDEHHISKPAFPVIDTHAHFGRLLLGDNYDDLYVTREVVEALKEKGVKHIVNLDGEWGSELDRMISKIHPFEEFILTFGSIDISRLDENGFEGYVRKTLQESVKKGIIGLKFWKNISLKIRDKSGRYIPIDDKRFDVIWHTAAEFELPILIHIADPVAFFKPIDRFNERYEELIANPDWSFCSEDLFSFEQLMEIQERLIANNPKTTFIVAHVGSYSENLQFVGNCLDKYPNMYVDIAQRISELGRQPYSARRFFIKYQDRILFGTDSTPKDITQYSIYYRFLETQDEYFDYCAAPIPSQGRWGIYGLGLESQILKKIYYSNAEKILLVQNKRDNL
jgi:Tat protein secretion system quality control protein TatD with DNase activity